MHDQTGRCGVGSQALLAAAEVHRGEEPPLITGAGSGTVFLAGCIARCRFCQNYQISLLRQGHPVTPENLADTFLFLQNQGCSNLNWVTPSPHLPFLLKALAMAMNRGCHLPVVYNCNGYMNVDIVTELDGIVDVYLPDMKYGEDVWAEKYSGLPEYSSINAGVVREMAKQVGALVIDSSGAALSGVLVRHLVLPGKIAGTARVLKTLASINPDIPISLMAQYRPCYEAVDDPVLGRCLYREEFEDAVELLALYGLTRAYVQSADALQLQDGYFPDFNRQPGKIFTGE
ncbi:radical SAM protein [bacterium]|nr:radical SAM protein [candidate division CSSED10-310 bacterium]